MEILYIIKCMSLQSVYVFAGNALAPGKKTPPAILISAEFILVLNLSMKEEKHVILQFATRRHLFQFDQDGAQLELVILSESGLEVPMMCVRTLNRRDGLIPTTEQNATSKLRNPNTTSSSSRHHGKLSPPYLEYRIGAPKVIDKAVLLPVRTRTV